MMYSRTQLSHLIYSLRVFRGMRWVLTSSQSQGQSFRISFQALSPFNTRISRPQDCPCLLEIRHGPDDTPNGRFHSVRSFRGAGALRVTYPSNFNQRSRHDKLFVETSRGHRKQQHWMDRHTDSRIEICRPTIQSVSPEVQEILVDN
jgi:hypothetical protein